MTRAVLLVDDSAIVIEAVKRWLRRAGYDVAVATTCEQARRLAQTRDFSAQVLDLHLADGRGVDLAIWLKEHTHCAATIFYTGYSEDQSHLEDARRLGRIVTKGATPEALLREIRDIIVAHDV